MHAGAFIHVRIDLKHAQHKPYRIFALFLFVFVFFFSFHLVRLEINLKIVARGRQLTETLSLIIR